MVRATVDWTGVCVSIYDAVCLSSAGRFPILFIACWKWASQSASRGCGDLSNGKWLKYFQSETSFYWFQVRQRPVMERSVLDVNRNDHVDEWLNWSWYHWNVASISMIGELLVVSCFQFKLMAALLLDELKRSSTRWWIAGHFQDCFRMK